MQQTVTGSGAAECSAHAASALLRTALPCTPANQYALYLVDERACLNALLGEPRLLTMTPDAVRLDLDDPCTSAEVAALARAAIRQDGMTAQDTCAVLAVVSCYRSANFVAAPPMEVRPDGTRLTSFRASLAKFAQISGSSAPEPGTPAWNRAVAKALATAREAISAGSDERTTSPPPAAPDDHLFGTDKTTSRLSKRMSAAEFDSLAEAAGLSVRAT